VFHADQRIDDIPDTATMKGMDMTITEEGDILVSYSDDRNGQGDIWVIRSNDGGENWSDRVQADGNEDSGGAGIMADEDRVVVTTVGKINNAFIGYYFAGGHDLDSWGSRVEPFSNSQNFVEGITGAFTPEGDLWFGGPALLQEGGAQLVIVKENEDYLNDNYVIFGDSDWQTTCECCPIDIEFSAGGAPQVAWRRNDQNIRNMAVAHGEAGADWFNSMTIATQTDPFFAGCPMSGPDMTNLSDGSLLLAWSDNSSGSWEPYTALSFDGGKSWTEESFVEEPDMAAVRKGPKVTEGVSGDVYLVYSSSVGGPTAATVSTDGGANYAASVPVSSPAGDLKAVKVRTGGEVTAMIGRPANAELQGVWFGRLE
jgi:hypothetical protein